MNPAVNALLGGWNTTGIFTANDGTPISPLISTSIDYSQTGGFLDRPNVVGKLKGAHCLPGTSSIPRISLANPRHVW